MTISREWRGKRVLTNLILIITVAGAVLPGACLLWLASVRPKTGFYRPDWLRAVCGGVGLWWPLQAGLDVAAMAPAPRLAWSFALAAVSALLLVTHHLTARVEGQLLSRRRFTRWVPALGMSAIAVCSTSSIHTDSIGLTLARTLGISFGIALLAGSVPRLVTSSRWTFAASVMVAATLATGALSSLSASAPWTQPALMPLMALLGVVIAIRRGKLTLGGHTTAESQSRTELAEDPLTRLPTRSYLERALQLEVVKCDKLQTHLALFFVDLDGFKPVNDTFGHSSGDEVLRQVGQRLRATIRSRDVVARIGGDEFVLLITDVRDRKAVSDRAQRVIDAIAQTYVVEGREVNIGCSIGISMYPDHRQPAKLVAKADAAMYAAKRAGGTGFCFYTNDMEDDAKERFDLLRDLRKAIEEGGQFELYYQPKVHAISGKVTGAEALIRWNHPTRGLLAPFIFIPLAERFGLIRSLGQWVIDDACRQARKWSDCGLRMRVAVNLSALQMRQDDIVEQIRDALERHQIDPGLLTCEITESVAMEDTRATQATFLALGSAGVHLSIDDFGTGYSSLAYLRKLPAEELKIDRTFVMDLELSPDARAVVNAVVKLAHALGLKVVAEGVENERQRDILREIGCDELQGFLFARPMRARSLLIWAMDDLQTKSESFASSLFLSTKAPAQAFESTRREAETALEPLSRENIASGEVR
jgi:diguanylate cyclase (GGDEF)-like protein